MTNEELLEQEKKTTTLYLILGILIFIIILFINNILHTYDLYRTYPQCFNGKSYNEQCITCNSLIDGINNGTLTDNMDRPIKWGSIEG